MVWSNVTVFFIIVATGSVLYSHHLEVRTAADAARALEPFAGRYAEYLFSAGILGAGMIAVLVLATSTAYATAGLSGWRRSLTCHANNAPQFYLVFGVAIPAGVQIAVYNVATGHLG